MDTEIIALYCWCDDYLKALNHVENTAYRLSDAEVITTAVLSAWYFAGHHDHARVLLEEQGYMPHMLSKSRFNRRLHQLSDVLLSLFQCLGQWHVQRNQESVYVVDSFPIAVCDNKRIRRCRCFQGQQWRGYQASKQRYFYGLKLHLLVTAQGQPVECHWSHGSLSDIQGLKQFDWNIPVGAEVLGDKAYNDYGFEDVLASVGIQLSPLRKSNSKRPIQAYVEYWRRAKRKVVETTGSLLERLMPKHIHSVTAQGLEIKLLCFLLALSFATLAA